MTPLVLPLAALLLTFLPLLLAHDPTKLANIEFWGRYNKTTDAPSNFDYLDCSSGELLAVFHGYPDHRIINSLDLYLLDPKYYDEKIVILQIKEIIAFNPDNDSWTNTSHPVTITKTWRERNGLTTIEQPVTSTITLHNLQAPDMQDIHISIQIKGQTFAFQAALAYKDTTLQCFLYNSYIALITLLQIYCGTKLLNTHGDNKVFLSKMSQVTLGLCGIVDFATAMKYIQYTISPTSGVIFFAIPSLAYILLFAQCDMRLMFLIWKSHNEEELHNQDQLRKRLTTFYIVFYLGLFLYLTLDYLCSNDEWLILLTHMLLIPQIIHNIRLAAKPIFERHYVFGFIAARLLVPLYERACPENYFRKRQDLTIACLLITIYLASILVLYIQHKLGSRFFLPKKYTLHSHDYLITLKINEHNCHEECSVCLQGIFSKELNTLAIQQQGLRQDLLQEAVVMVTPCNHLFHQQCLASWMDIKMECPTCRSKLPQQ